MKSIIIYDLETSSVDVDKAVPRIMGFYSSKKDGFQYCTNISTMIDLLHSHDIVVGYNNIQYDDEILKKYGYSTWGKITIDLMQVLHGKGFGSDKGRKGIIKLGEDILDHILHSKSLDAISQVLGGPAKLADIIDYNWFQHPFRHATTEQQELIIKYLERDLEMTKFVYLFLEKYFTDFRIGGIEIEGEFRPFMTEEQVEKKQYLTASVASWTYKAICNITGIPELYSDGNVEREWYEGGFVSTPSQEACSGKIYGLDFNSLYPHIMIMCNLYGPSEQGWKGTGVFETAGTYDNTNLSKVSSLLKDMYNLRLNYKKQKDSREYTIKIIINTIYGLLGNPVFQSVHSYQAAADCTRLGRQWVNAARKHFMEAGYNVLYSDTDSVYLEDVFNDINKLTACKDEFIKFILDNVPFPVKTFNMGGLDEEIKFMMFESSNGELLKKRYLYVTKDNEVTIKGMDIIKSTATPLGVKLFEEYIKPHIISDGIYKFTRRNIETWMSNLLNQDLKYAARFYKVKAADTYANNTQLQSQIASHKLYGEGEHYLLKLKGPHENGVGTAQNYLGVQYAKGINMRLIDVSATWSELSTFIKEDQTSLAAFL